MSPYDSYRVMLIAYLVHSSTAATKCYKPDGTSVGSEFTPCNNTTKFSMCYRTGTGIWNNVDTTCFPNGISLNIDNITGVRSYWRQMCTDASWESPNCLKAFDRCTKDGNANSIVNPCDGTPTSNTWCCGFSNTTCCNGPDAISVEAVIGASSESTSRMSYSIITKSTVAPSSTGSNLSNPTSRNDIASNSVAIAPSETSALELLPKSSNKGLSTGAKVAILISAAVVGVAIILGLTFLLVKKRRQRSNFVDSPRQTFIKPEPLQKWPSSLHDEKRQPIYEAGPGIPKKRYELESP